MKKLFISTVISVYSFCGFAQTTATNFTVNDCAGTNHDLFSELNAGKVVVISFVMPCASCIGPSLSAFNEVQNYSSSYPGRVVFYLADDYGNTSCTTLNNWANTNGMSGANAVFSNTAVNMSNYGSSGMPKIVVLAGTNHQIFFNQNNGLNVTNLNNAIAQGLVTGIAENAKADFKLSLFPNPSTTNKTTLQYSLSENSDVTIEIYNALGAKVKSTSFENQAVGKHESIMDFNVLDNGIYFVKLNAGKNSQVLKFNVAH
jgi:hypothetical protein